VERRARTREMDAEYSLTGHGSAVVENLVSRAR
jgi:hypothetical protein